jgi:hypothetical protein
MLITATMIKDYHLDAANGRFSVIPLSIAHGGREDIIVTSLPPHPTITMTVVSFMAKKAKC